MLCRLPLAIVRTMLYNIDNENKQTRRTAGKEDIMKKRFMVIDSRKDGLGDEFISWHDTPAAACSQAAKDWESLTPAEKEKRHIYCGVVTPDDLTAEADNPDFYDEKDPACCNGMNWGLFSQFNDFPGAFDSEKI